MVIDIVDLALTVGLMVSRRRADVIHRDGATTGNRPLDLYRDDYDYRSDLDRHAQDEVTTARHGRTTAGTNQLATLALSRAPRCHRLIDPVRAGQVQDRQPSAIRFDQVVSATLRR
jgi:hypothetical protein